MYICITRFPSGMQSALTNTITIVSVNQSSDIDMAQIYKKKVLSSNHSNHVDCSLQTYTQCSVSAAILIEYAEMWIIFAYPGKIYSNFVQKTLR